MKKNNFRAYLKTGLSLATIAAVCGFLIAFLHMITQPIIKENAEKREKEKLSEVYRADRFEKIKEGDITVYEAIKSDVSVGKIYRIKGKNAYGELELLIGINGGKVEEIVVLRNTESYRVKVEKFIDGLREAENTDDVELRCGATAGAKLAKELIEKALEADQGGSDNGS